MGKMISWVVSHDVVELNIIDFIRCFSRKTFLDDVEFLFWDLHLEVVKDRSETGEVNKASPGLILVLVVWLDQ